MDKIEFGHKHPFTELIIILEQKAFLFCHKCRDRDRCFGDVVFHIEQIDRCKKLPELYKQYWKVKGQNIIAISPLIIYKEKEEC